MSQLWAAGAATHTHTHSHTHTHTHTCYTPQPHQYLPSGLTFLPLNDSRGNKLCLKATTQSGEQKVTVYLFLFAAISGLAMFNFNTAPVWGAICSKTRKRLKTTNETVVKEYEEEEGKNERDEKLAVSILGHGHNMRLLETTKAIVNRSLAYREIPTAGFN